MDYRYSEKKIKRFIEWIYVSQRLAFHEQMAYAKRRGSNPYPAKYGSLEVRTSKDSGLPDRGTWRGQIICGGNPWLFARMVRDVVAYVDEEGREHLKWKERLHPALEGGKIVSDWVDCEIIR